MMKIEHIEKQECKTNLRSCSLIGENVDSRRNLRFRSQCGQPSVNLRSIEKVL